jgi:Na+/H+ antiporter NhaD/arsenite permease-like protein
VTHLIPLLALLSVLALPGLAHASGGGGGAHGAVPPFWTTTFFVTMLLCIAILPLTRVERWWEHNRNKLLVSGALGIYPLIHVVFVQPNFHALGETIHEYVSFIILLGTLFYASGGILLTGDLKGNPKTNTTFIAFGTLIASFVGTTGASMLLIRPLLRTNHERRYRVHVVIFFIFLVSNIGGSLLPIGDPPLFLGYLQGVPFLWTLNLYKQMAIVAIVLLVVFYLLDRHFYKKESLQVRKEDAATVEPLRVRGLVNLIWLLGIVLCVALIGPEYGLLREAAMIGCAVGSGLTTKKEIRKQNQFTWFPILEVAALFIGIFVTMIPALIILKAHGGQLGVDSPAKFFWVTGFLSSFLDNAPTYLVFFKTAQGMVDQGVMIGELVAEVGIPFRILIAISTGAVFMGANTYIGNGPNFMVKAIAEEQKIAMPSFFGYMRWSMIFLVPLFVIVTLIFYV